MSDSLATTHGALRGALGWLPRYSRRQLGLRVLLAAPFALSVVLTLVLGPGTINGRYASFTWLAVVSLVGTLLMLGVTERLFIPVGLLMFLGFPLLAGLGFDAAPGWARPAVIVIFYGSILASVAATLTGVVVAIRSILGAHPRASAIAAGGLVLVVLGALVGLAGRSSARSGVAGAASAPTMAVNMGSVINTAQREAEPSFTADGQTMVFNCQGTDICMSHLESTWQQGTWTRPQLVPSPISSAYIEVEPWINAAGTKLYFNSSRPFGHASSLPGLALYVDAVGQLTMALGVSPFGGLGQDDIWVSDLRGGVWSQPRNLSDVPGEPPVNTKFADHCLAFSADGNQAFWTSTRPGGFGGNDIWTSRRVDGSWTKPENLGPKVNGPGSEHHSIPTPDGRSLYVTSDRPGGLGGEDIYVTTREPDGTRGKLVNAGPLVNGPSNDRCAAWTPDGRIFLFDSDRAGGFGSKDLWWVYVANLAAPTPGTGSASDVGAAATIRRG